MYLYIDSVEFEPHQLLAPMLFLEMYVYLYQCNWYSTHEHVKFFFRYISLMGLSLLGRLQILRLVMYQLQIVVIRMTRLMEVSLVELAPKFMQMEGALTKLTYLLLM